MTTSNHASIDGPFISQAIPQSNQINSRELKLKSLNNQSVRHQINEAKNTTSIVCQSTEIPSTKGQFSALYQKAQQDVLTNKQSKIKFFTDKNKEPEVVSAKLKLNSTPVYASNRREQSHSKKHLLNSQNIDLNVGYASPSLSMEKIPISKIMQTYSKENDIKLANFISPTSKISLGGNESNTSYDLTKSKMSHRLDLSNYSQSNRTLK